MTPIKSILLVKYHFLKVTLIFKFWWYGAFNDLLTHFSAPIAQLDTYKADNNDRSTHISDNLSFSF